MSTMVNLRKRKTAQTNVLRKLRRIEYLGNTVKEIRSSINDKHENMELDAKKLEVLSLVRDNLNKINSDDDEETNEQYFSCSSLNVEEDSCMKVKATNPEEITENKTEELLLTFIIQLAVTARPWII